MSDSSLDRPDIHTRLADWGVLIALLVLANYLVVQPRLEGTTGEGQVRTLGVSVAVLAAITAYLWLLTRRSRRALLRIEDMLTDVRFGTGTRRDREAIDILVRALRTPDPNVQETAKRTLRKITGEDLGDRAEAWETWWKVARPSFSRPGPPPGAPPPSPPSRKK